MADETIRKIEEHGREVYETLSETTYKDDMPIMIPPAPECKHYDIFNIEEHDDILSAPGEARSILRHQKEWEAEVKFYRALEMLEEDIVVIHSLLYLRN
jgi:hypothetical protein